MTAMPTEPTSSSGLRPTRSTRPMAIKVVRMLVTDVITVIASELASVKPTACHGPLRSCSDCTLSVCMLCWISAIFTSGGGLRLTKRSRTWAASRRRCFATR